MRNAKLLERTMNALLRGENGTHPLEAGAYAPSFRLRDDEEKVVSAERLLRKGPLVVVFYRGEWCGYLDGFDGGESWTLPLSALYVIALDGMVLYSEVHTDYAKQASSQNALTVLRAYKRR